jgi:hypothetical protein
MVDKLTDVRQAELVILTSKQYELVPSFIDFFADHSKRPIVGRDQQEKFLKFTNALVNSTGPVLPL